MDKKGIIVRRENKPDVKVVREETDPMCLRASIGGSKKDGYYLVYRGDNVDDIEQMLTETLEALRMLKDANKC